MSSIDSGKQTLESMSQAVWYNRWTLKKFEEYLNGKILEVGCGIGNFTNDLSKYGQIYAIDLNENYIKQLQKKVGNRIEVGIGDIESGTYFFDNKKFNSIVCINVLEHIENDLKSLKNMYSLLEKEGYLILLVPAFAFLYGEIDKAIGHYRRYDLKKIIYLLKKVGFTITKVKKINFLGAIGWWFSSKILSDNKVSEEKIKIFNKVSPFILPLEDIIEPPFGTSILVIAKK